MWHREFRQQIRKFIVIYKFYESRMTINVWTSASKQKKDRNNKYVKNFTCAMIDETWSFTKEITIKISSEVQLKKKSVKKTKKKINKKIDTKELIKEKSRRKDCIWEKSTRKKFIWKISTQKESRDIRRKLTEEDKIFERKSSSIETLFSSVLFEPKF